MWICGHVNHVIVIQSRKSKSVVYLECGKDLVDILLDVLTKPLWELLKLLRDALSSDTKNGVLTLYANHGFIHTVGGQRIGCPNLAYAMIYVVVIVSTRRGRSEEVTSCGMSGTPTIPMECSLLAELQQAARTILGISKTLKEGHVQSVLGAIQLLADQEPVLQKLINLQIAPAESSGCICDLPVEENPDPEWPSRGESKDPLDALAAEFERYYGLTHNGRALENGGRWLHRASDSSCDSSD
ncbi:hypothetical protein R1sor_015678 [Riccia sorocarpa]|uniref:Uncharacterized protein n=1 Tax=Riccia sorocarpa TaxID=122646 RepID=A0ABD3HFX7_9MARC